MNQLHPDILEIIKALAAGKGKVLVRVAQAAKMLDCDPKTFKRRYVNTELIKEIYPMNCKHAHYSVFDIIRVPELMMEREEYIKQQCNENETQHRAKNINELLDELGPIWKPERRGAA